MTIFIDNKYFYDCRYLRNYLESLFTRTVYVQNIFKKNRKNTCTYIYFHLYFLLYHPFSFKLLWNQIPIFHEVLQYLCGFRFRVKKL